MKSIFECNRIKIYFLLTILALLQGCNSTNKTFLKSSAEQLQKKYHYPHSNLIITYDLIKLNNSNCLYAKDFGRIINYDTYNKAFLKKIKYCTINEINKQAMVKSCQIRDLLLKLNIKYSFLTIDQLHTLKKNNNSNHIEELEKLDKIALSIPIMLPEYKIKITSHYGMRRHPRKKRQKFHCGIDLQGDKAAPIYAAADGKIITVGRKSAYGNLIEIKHPSKFITKYAHLQKIYVREGDCVIRGQLIGLQGNSGNSTAEHLHFEILVNNQPINPFDFIGHACNC